MGAEHRLHNTSFLQVAFGIYVEAFRPIGGGTIHAMEMDTTEFGAANPVHPYTSSFAGVSSGLWLASGGGNEVGTTDASIAIHILNNNSKWKTGIAFDADGLTGTDGVTGAGEAIALAKGHELNWYFAGNNVGFQIWSDVDAVSDAQILHVDTNGAKIVNNGGGWNFRIAKVSGTLTGNLAALSSTSGDPSIIAEGSATNIPISLTPKGIGQIRLDAAVINTGASASTGDVGLELGGERTGSGNVYVDLHAAAGSDFEARLLRQSGANGNFVISNTSTGSIQFDAANAAGVTQFLINSLEAFRADGSGLNLASGKVMRVNSVQVVGARDTGWTAITGTPDESTAYATGSVTLPQLAGRVMALQTALTTHGLIGA